MAKFWSCVLVAIVACFVAVGSLSAQEKKQRIDPGLRFDEMEKAAGHDPLKGELTKEEFVKAMKESGGKMADRAEDFYNRITKADEKKVTKTEYVAAMKAMGGKKKKEK